MYKGWVQSLQRQMIRTKIEDCHRNNHKLIKITSILNILTTIVEDIHLITFCYIFSYELVYIIRRILFHL